MIIDNNRLESLIKRQFKHEFEIYIYDTITRGKTEDFIGRLDSRYKDMSENKLQELKKTINQYTYALQLTIKDDKKDGKIYKEIFGKTIKEIDDGFKDDSIPTQYNELYSKYKELGFKKQIKEDLEKLLEQSKEGSSLQCHYCGITEELIETIINETKNDKIDTENRFFTKRFFYNRGRSMEIDQIDPNLGYRYNNMVLACYWCNNAKTDEFDYYEFKQYIAPSIREIWIKRFEKIPEAPGLRKIDDNK